MHAPSARPPRSFTTAMLRGMKGLCPNCGQGRLFGSFLKVNAECPSCGEALHHHRADDFPAYLVIVIVGHIVVPMVLALETAYAPPYWLHALLWLPLTLGLCLVLLQPVKGAVVGAQWAGYMHGFDPNDKTDRVELYASPAPERRQ